MNKPQTRLAKRANRLDWQIAIVLTGLTCGSTIASDWWWSAGPVFRVGMDIKITGSSYAQTLGLNTDAGIGVGAADVYADRAYDNGYVGLSPSTGNPNALDPNTTWNWGYNANSLPSQYDATAGTLSFQRQGIPRYSALTPGGRGGEEDMLGAGLRLEIGLPLTQGHKWSFDLVFGFQAIWAEGKYRENAALVDLTDTYDVAGIVSTAFTDLDHRGTYNGPFDPAATSPYTIIPNLPASRTVAPSALPAAAPSRITLDVDQGLYVLHLGPQLGFKASPRLQFVAQPTISLNLLDVDVHRSETFSYNGAPRQWSNRAGALHARVGLGLAGGANVDLGKGWFIGAFGGYEWLPDDADFTIGPNRVTVDPSGWVAGAVLGKQY